MARPPFQVGDFVGQRDALRPVLREQDGAIARGEPMPPILFTGHSGTGKSLGARMLAGRARTELVKFSGSESLPQIVEQLCQLKTCDIAFFDECHKLSDDVQEMLYDVIDTRSIPNRLVPNATGSAKIAAITLIFATDQPGRLLNALFKRIPTNVQFRPYPESELKEIVARVAARKNVLLSAQAARQLAKICNGLPRRAEHHVVKIRLYYEDSERRQLGCEDVEKYLNAYHIDADGLGKNEQRCLVFLARNRSASLEALAGHLGTDAAFVRRQVEQPLRYRGLITVRSSGRALTRLGKQWVRQYCQARQNKKRKRHDEQERPDC